MRRFRADFERRGYGWWAVEVRATGTLIGFAGLDDVDAGLPFDGVGSPGGSQAMMRRIGMTRDAADDFDDPAVPEGPLRADVVFRIAP